jgi:general secretion pathway protein G
MDKIALQNKVIRRTGFTLVEILIVVVILGILGAIVIPQYMGASEEVKGNTMKSDLRSIRTQIQLYTLHHNDSFPENGTATFEECMTGKTDVIGAVGTGFGPYLERIPRNPFNNKNTVGTNGTAGDNSDGWEYNSTTGTFAADDSPEHAQF